MYQYASHNSRTTERIFNAFDIVSYWIFLLKSVETFQIWLESDNLHED
jgi:hypothetical protein